MSASLHDVCGCPHLQKEMNAIYSKLGSTAHVANGLIAMYIWQCCSIHFLHPVWGRWGEWVHPVGEKLGMALWLKEH